MPDYDAIKDMVEAIQDRGVGMTPYEREFIASVTGQFKMRGFLSPKQIVLIERIYKERTPDGRSDGHKIESQMTRDQKLTERFRTEGRFDGPRSRERRGWRERGYDE